MTRSDAAAARWQLVAASVATGVLAAVAIFASEARIGLADFAPLAQLWTIWALSAASITFGSQQWSIRRLLAGDRPSRIRARLVVRALPLAVAVWFAGAAFSDTLFGGDQAFPVLAGSLVLGAAVNGHGRGAAAVAGSTGVLAVLIVGENLIRVLLLVPIMIVDADPIWYGVAVVAGFGVNAIVTDRWSGQATTTVPSVPGGLVIGTLAGAVGYTTMFGGPLLLAAAGAADTLVSAVFLVVAVARVPFVVVLGLLPRLALDFERLAGEGQHDLIVTRSRRIAVAALAGGCVVAVVALAIADRTLGRWLGTDDEFGADVYALIGGASILALAGLALTMAVLAVGHHLRLAGTWTVPFVAAIVGVAAGWFDDVELYALVLGAVELVVVGGLLAAVCVPRRRRADSVER